MALEFTNDITNGDPEGSGVFDVIMKSISAHLLGEYNAQRIRDEDYSTVYLGSIQAALTQAVQFKIGKEQAFISSTKSDAEIRLIEQQTITEKGQTEFVADGLVGKQQALTEAQKDKVNEDLRLITQKILTEKGQVEDVAGGLIGSEQDIKEQQILSSQQDVLKSIQEVALISEKVVTEQGQNENRTDGLIGKQQALLDAQIALNDWKALSEKANTVTPTEGIMRGQYDRMRADALLTEAKYLTEQAQTSDTIKTVDGASVTVSGYMAEQIASMKAQAEKMANDSLLTMQRGVTEATQTGTTFVDGSGVPHPVTLPTDSDGNVIPGGIAGFQVTKMTAETDLLNEKKTSEEAQTVDATGGLLKTQQDLYKQQTWGFIRDAEQKTAKIVASAYQIRESTGTNATVPASLDEASIDSVINKLKFGVGII